MAQHADGTGPGAGHVPPPSPVDDGAPDFAEEHDTLDEPQPEPGLLGRLRRWSHGGRSRRILWQSAVLVVGLALVIAGLAMLVLPGPGWAAIILGLVVLASEYAWAEAVLSPVRRAADRAASAAFDPRRRRTTIALLAVALAAVIVATSWYVATYGATLDGLRWLPGV